MTYETKTFFRRLLQCGLLCLAVFALAGAGDPATRFNELGHQMMCICGCGQILLECNHVGCPDSDGMRNELKTAVSRGDSDSLVEQSFVQKYGPTVLAAPTATGFDRTAWIVPFVALGLGLGVVVLVSAPGRTVPRPRSPTACAPCAARNSNNSATRPARRPTYELRTGLLPVWQRLPRLFYIFFSGQLSIWARRKPAPHTCANAEMRSTKICAT